MFTVLIKHKTTRRECIYQAEQVECQEFGEDAGLLLTYSNGSQTHIGVSLSETDYRDVFVMNSDGKTVARYLI